MAQFRTTADILDEVLQKAGEVTNGNSPFETLALTYANKVHHAIIGGGNIFNLEADETWSWAKSRFPIVLELEPAYTTGTLTCTVDDINITFSSAPSDSLEGWHIQAIGKSTVYRITQHTATSTTAKLDSSFVDDTGAYNFRAFKLDYEILSAYMYVDNYNDRVDFGETASTTLSATLTHSAYSPTNLISHVASRLQATGTATWTGSYDSVLKQFSLTSSVTSKLFGATGPNKRRSAMPLIGFDRLNVTGATSFTSAYTPNAIARMIEPFKLFTSEGGEPFIYSSDPVKMQEDYPIAQTDQRIPDRFVRLTEENDGTVWVRFNAYPRYKTKVTIDWIPQPIDLQDNAASFPMLPRGDVDTLIHGAAAYIAFDKEDSKWEGLLGLCKTGLDAMKKKNRMALFRTGEFFGQQVPRKDMQGLQKKLNFGYTVTGTTAAATTAESTQSMIAVTISYTSFSAGSTTSTVTARTLPSNRNLFSMIIKHSASFTGASITNVALDVGISGDPTKFINGFDVDQATASSAQDSVLTNYYPAADTGILVRAISTGANLSALTVGTVVLYFQETIVP